MFDACDTMNFVNLTFYGRIKMRKIILSVFAFFAAVHGICAASFVDKVVRAKTEFYFYDSDEKILEKIAELESSLDSIADMQEKLICRNLLLVEKLNFSPVQDDSQLKKLFFVEMSALARENQKYMEENKNADKWLLVSYSDLLVRLMEYQSSKEIYKMSLETKKLYLQALKIDSKFAYAYNSYSLWLYFAPSIAGGGLDVAYKNISKAVKYAAAASDKYGLYVYYINRSQILYKMKKFNDYDRDLNLAHELFPEETFTESLREMNRNDKILFNS